MANEIIKVLDALAEKFGLAIDWTNVNIIPYIKELCGKLVTYEIATSVVWIIIAVVLIVSTTYLMKYGKKELEEGDDEWGALCIGAGIVFFAAGIIMFIFQTFDIVTCLTIPEKIIFEEFKSIYNGIN